MKLNLNIQKRGEGVYTVCGLKFKTLGEAVFFVRSTGEFEGCSMSPECEREWRNPGDNVVNMSDYRENLKNGE